MEDWPHRTTDCGYMLYVAAGTAPLVICRAALKAVGIMEVPTT
jgi:hypothetical protein